MSIASDAIILESITRPGAIIRLKLSHSLRIGLLTASILSSAAFCAAQSASQTQAPDPAPSAQSSDTSSSKPGTSSSKPDEPGAQAPAQDNSQPPNTPATDKTQQVKGQDDKTKAKKDDRMFYVMPNYLTVGSESQVTPLSAKEKFAIAAKGSFDPYEFTIVGVVAAIRQADNSYPGFGQGWKGYAKRYGAAFADQVDGNIMVGGVFPSILKTDPRYFQLGKGSFGHRFGYAISRIFVTRTDSGRRVFNVSEFAGNAAAIAISNLYYPASDRGAASSAQGFATQVGIDAFGNELKEFWPDIHHYLQQKHERHLQKQQEKEQQKNDPQEKGQQKAPN